MSGYPLKERLQHYVSESLIFASSPSQIQTSVNETISKLQCGYDTSVQCRTSKGRLLQEIGVYIFQAVVLVTALRIIRLGFVASVATPLVFILAYPIIMRRTYGLQFGCSVSLYPVLPVCLVSDVQDILYTFTPPQLPWPAPLVVRNGTSISVFDCPALGFGDGVHELVFYANTYLPPGWLNVFPAATVSTFLPLRSALQVMPRNATAEYTQCAALYSFTIIPVVLILALAVLTLLALIHLALVMTGHLASVLKNVYFAIVAAYIGVVAAE